MAIRKRIQIPDKKKMERVTVPQEDLKRTADLKQSRLRIGDVRAGPNLSGVDADRLRSSYLRGKKCIGTFRWHEVMGPMEIYETGIPGYYGVIYPDGAVIISPLGYWESRMKLIGPPPSGETLSDRLVAKHKKDTADRIKSGRVRVDVTPPLTAARVTGRVRVELPARTRVRV